MSITGKNIRQVLAETGETDIFKIDIKEVKKTFKFNEISDEDKWRIKLIKELTDVRQGALHVLGEGDSQDSLLTNDEMLEIIHYVSTSWRMTVFVVWQFISLCVQFK